ncbi:hypothetical protein LTR27_005966 [Elasticomyces elasticus]|nr:hypothetical protein LTR27_005966 [Elasticomyces elasticus]
MNINFWKWAGGLLAAASLAIAMYSVYYNPKAMRITIWTAIHDFRNDCLADLARNITSAECEVALSHPADPPPVTKRSAPKEPQTDGSAMAFQVILTISTVCATASFARTLGKMFRHEWLIRCSLQNITVETWAASSSSICIVVLSQFRVFGLHRNTAVSRNAAFVLVGYALVFLYTWDPHVVPEQASNASAVTVRGRGPIPHL